MTHELAGDISSAITFHEMHLKLAKKVADPAQQKTANLESFINSDSTSLFSLEIKAN